MGTVRKKTILVVDDSRVMRSTIAQAIQSIGVEALQAENGEEGVKVASRHIPNLILMDLRMPGIDGLEACRRLKENEMLKNIPVIMVTVESEESLVREAIRAGASDYIIKPVHYKELIEKLRRYL